MPAPKKPDEDMLQIGAQIITLDARLGQSLDKEEYRAMFCGKNASGRIDDRLEYIAESVGYTAIHIHPLNWHKVLDILVEKCKAPRVGFTLDKVSFKETSSENKTMEGPKHDDWLTLVHDIGVNCGSKSQYPDFEGHSVMSWGECYFKKDGRPNYKDGLGVFPDILPE